MLLHGLGEQIPDLPIHVSDKGGAVPEAQKRIPDGDDVLVFQRRRQGAVDAGLIREINRPDGHTEDFPGVAHRAVDEDRIFGKHQNPCPPPG